MTGSVANGKHVVPDGVEVQEFKKNLTPTANDCTPSLKSFLQQKDLIPAYEQLVIDIKTSHPNDYFDIQVFGSNHKEQLKKAATIARQVADDVSIQDDFAMKGVKVAWCLRESRKQNIYQWLEFIDTEKFGDKQYVPQYDVGNWSKSQVVETEYTTLHFPNGITILPLTKFLNDWNKRGTFPLNLLKEGRTPSDVNQLMLDKNLMDAYRSLERDCNSKARYRSLFHKQWDFKTLKRVIEQHKSTFMTQNVDLFLCYKDEKVGGSAGFFDKSGGFFGSNTGGGGFLTSSDEGHYGSTGGGGPFGSNGGGRLDVHYWIEFVDRDVQPNYFPQWEGVYKPPNHCCTVILAILIIIAVYLYMTYKDKI